MGDSKPSVGTQRKKQLAHSPDIGLDSWRQACACSHQAAFFLFKSPGSKQEADLVRISLSATRLYTESHTCTMKPSFPRRVTVGLRASIV